MHHLIYAAAFAQACRDTIDNSKYIYGKAEYANEVATAAVAEYERADYTGRILLPTYSDRELSNE
jgi:hypothetical protein